MDLFRITSQNLISPVILFFTLGLIAGAFKSTLTIPKALSSSISLYLMMSIGFRGGVELSHGSAADSIAYAVVGAVALSALLPFLAYALLRFTTRVTRTDAAAVAAHYGSVSVVTFAAAVAVLNHQEQSFEPYIVALLAVMEAPAILTGLYLARRKQETNGSSGLLGVVTKEVLLHGSVALLLGSFAIGFVTGPQALADLKPVLVDPFQGVLCLFLLDMGLVVARRLPDLKGMGVGVAAFGVYMPLAGGLFGTLVGHLLGLSVGGVTLLAVLGASASYIVVPAVMRGALPAASPAIYLTLALGITFPFNLMVGIPLYLATARQLAML